MKTKSLLLLMCTLLIVACQQKETSPVVQTNHVLQEKFDEYFSALTKLGKFNGVVYVNQNRETALHKTFNLSADTQHSLYVTKENQFDIHSVSKIMAYYLLLQLEKEGEISQADKLSQFIPDFPQGDKITIGMLLHHKSGLPRELTNFNGKLIDLNVAQIVDLAKQEALLFEPGIDTQYSNIGFQLLYSLIGSITNESFEEQLNNRLFSPLKMNDSGAHYYMKQNKLKNLAANHEQEEDTIVRVDNILEDEFKQARIYSTADDLMILLNKFQEDALAHSMAKDSVIQHSGGSDGVRAHVYCDLKTKVNVVFLSNFDGIPFEATVKDVVSIIENKPYDVPKALNRKAIAVEAKSLHKYKGAYTFADMNKLNLMIDVSEGQLVVFQDKEQIATLVAENDSTFFADPKEPESFEFLKNEKETYDVLMGWRGVKLKGIRK